MGVTLLAYQFLPRRLKSPLLGGEFDRRQTPLNRDTVIGSAIFGIGWGLCGVCPGPANEKMPGWAPATCRCCGRWRAAWPAPACTAGWSGAAKS